MLLTIPQPERAMALLPDDRTRDTNRAIGEQLQVNIRLGFLIVVLVALVSGVTVFVSLRTDVVTMLAKVETLQHTIDENQKQMIEMQLGMQQFKDRLELIKAICPGVPVQ